MVMVCLLVLGFGFRVRVSYLGLDWVLLFGLRVGDSNYGDHLGFDFWLQGGFRVRVWSWV